MTIKQLSQFAWNNFNSNTLCRTVVAALTLLPLLLILSLSLQTGQNKYGWLPTAFDWSAYTRVLYGDELGIRSSVVRTVSLLLPVTLLSGIVAVALVFRLRAVPLAVERRLRILFIILSFSFLPAYVLYAALNLLFEFSAGGYGIRLAKLAIGYTVSGIAVFSVVMLLMVSPNELRTQFEQLVLDGVGRWSAFRSTYLTIKASGLVAAFLITFSVLWSEFLLAVHLAPSQYQTFAVHLGGARGQHDVDFPLYAVGAALSLLVFASIIVLVSAGQALLPERHRKSF